LVQQATLLSRSQLAQRNTAVTTETHWTCTSSAP